MQRTIQKITQQFVDRLPENDQYYRVDELRSWEIPSFIVQRIQIELERNLAESMVIPKTDWANTRSQAVVDAWQKFVGAIRAEARLPASYGKTVIETAVADVVEILVQPRKNIPSVVFGTDDELQEEKIRDRVKAVVVYRHFSRLIPRYMKKKELDKLSRERCAEIVANADQKFTAGYSPLNWAQMLEPLFRLVDGEIDTNLLRLFFEDKNMPRIAREFDLMNKSLSRAEFIEVLSSPDLLDFDGYESGQSTLFEDQPPSEPEKQPENKPKKEETDQKTPVDPETKSEEETPEEDDEDSELPDKEQISAILFPDEKSKKEVKDGEESDDVAGAESGNEAVTEHEKGETEAEPQEEDATLNKNFSSEEPQPEAEEDDSLNAAFRSESENGSGNKKMASREQDEEDETSGEEEQTKPEEKKSSENGRQEASEKEEETPMWMRFMSDEEIEEYKKEEKVDEDGFIDDPIIDLTEEGNSDRDIEALKTLLETDRELFVEEIFRGSERAFDEAVENIAGYKKWRRVSKYIEKDIFKRNLVDMYSEAAVDFTDRLQTYFLEKQKQDK